MLKPLVALALAGTALVWGAQAGSLVRRTDAQASRAFESFLPPAAPSVPWLNLDAKTRLPKGDYPLGRDAGRSQATPFVLRAPHIEHADLAAFALGGG
jgi:hypothetical protein